MTEHAETHGAVCLDGSPGNFYWAPATDPKLASTWILFFEGGGWCYSAVDCTQRSHKDLGSTKLDAPTMTQTGYSGGIFNADSSVNPEWAGANHVYMRYCDGASFSGDRNDVVNTTGTPLYFRGFRILQAILDNLLDDKTYGLSSATDVMLSGCSAGGLSVLLHADYVGSRLKAAAPQLQRYKAVSCSGFFLDHANVDGLMVYQTQIQAIFELANATSGMNQDCLADHSSNEAWKCMMNPNAYDYVETPIMLLNSALDRWQTCCILSADPIVDQTINGNCTTRTNRGSLEFPVGCACCNCEIETTCDAASFDHFVTYETDFMSILRGTNNYHKAGNAAFIHSCYTHCAGSQDGSYSSIVVNGTHMYSAVANFWNGISISPDSFLPCAQRGPDQEHCNPTCKCDTCYPWGGNPPDDGGDHTFGPNAEVLLE